MRTQCTCEECRLDPMTPDDRATFLADEAMFLLAPMLEAAGDHETARRQRDWAMATYPARGTA